jgi:hypothetical protein
MRTKEGIENVLRRVLSDFVTGECLIAYSIVKIKGSLN